MTNACAHCGNGHIGRCPLVKSIEYFEDGRIKRIEYHEPHQYTPPVYAKTAVAVTIPGQDGGTFFIGGK